MRRLLFATKSATPVLWAALALVLLGLAPAVGRADVILGNLGAGDLLDFRILDQNSFAAYSFTMGTQAYSLSDVQLTLRLPAANTLFTLESDAGGASRPSGITVAVFSNPDLTRVGPDTFTFTPVAPFTLAPNTTYWLVGRTTGLANTFWDLSSPLTIPSGSGATFSGYKISNDGATWTLPNSPEAPLVQVDGTLLGVPEPSSLLLVGTVACTAAAVGWRRRRNRRLELAVVTAPPADGK